jgi:hypothetical protein
VYSGYADDTTVYLKDASELDLVMSLFNEYSQVAGMKLNIGKCSPLPLGSLIDHPKPINCPVRWLTDPSEFERLLGVPISIEFQSMPIWADLFTKLLASVRHWSAQNLLVFGRVHVARSYLGSKAWHLATMIPLDSTALKRFTAMLWAYVQNNHSLVPLLPPTDIIPPGHVILLFKVLRQEV